LRFGGIIRYGDQVEPHLAYRKASKCITFALSGFKPEAFIKTDCRQHVTRDEGYGADRLKHDKLSFPVQTSLYRMLSFKGHEELDGIAILKLFDGKDSV